MSNSSYKADHTEVVLVIQGVFRTKGVFFEIYEDDFAAGAYGDSSRTIIALDLGVIRDCITEEPFAQGNW
jgi:hypothetical protein